DHQGALISWRSLLKARDPSFRQEPLAALGASLALCRHTTSASGFAGRTFDVGTYEREEVDVIEVHPKGRPRRQRLFAPDRAADAGVRLYERSAELQPAGPARARATGTARSVAAHMGSLDLDRMLSAVAPDADHNDHRSLIGVGLMRGVQGFRESLGALFEAADGIANRVDDIFRVRPDAALLHVTNSGTDRRSGGPYERPFLLLWIFGADGLMTHAELFDVGHEDEALARFDELIGEPATALPPAAPSHATARRKRRVHPNAATANAARVDAAMAARDADTLPGLLADQVEVVDHSTGTTWDRQGMLASWRALLNARNPTLRTEPLATLGASLALCREWVSASGFTGRTFDVGPYDMEELVTIEVDANGRRRWSEGFAAGRLDDAMVRLYERYAELLPAGPERTRAAATARAAAATQGPPDLDRQASAWAADIESVDDRILGTWFARGAEAHRRDLGSVLEVADDVVFGEDEIVGLGPDVLLTRRTHSGTDRASGGRYERVFIWLRAFGTDGLITRIEFFDSDREDEALARFDALTAQQEATGAGRAPPDTVAQRTRRVRPTAATANAVRLDAVIAARDMDALPALFTEDAEFSERPTGVVYDRDGVL